MTLQSFPIVGLTKGFQNNVKPAMLPDQAWAILENAYTFRERELKREGRKFLGRLQRDLTGLSLGNTVAGSSMTFSNIFASFIPPIGASETNKSIVPGSLVITVGGPDTAKFTDNGDGTFTVTGAGEAAGSYVNYSTGRVVLQFTALLGGAAITADISYYPNLPVMGIRTREIASVNAEQTIWFDTTYAYIWNGSTFQEFIPGTTWSGTDSDLFWTYNYRGVNPQDRLFFASNNVVNGANPIRYTDGVTWTDFVPQVTATNSLFQARIIVAYYGRLLMLNVWEGPTASGAGGSANIFNRCRFSQLGDPVDTVNSFRSDLFGKGGFLDAPTNEEIVSALFIKNTLVVQFEQTTWQLRYVGEYGLPFIWERISADFGSESTFSTVLFDNHMLSIGDKAITSANAVGVSRIDLDIPDQVFDFKNSNNGVERITGIRDYQRELVFWNYPDAQTAASGGASFSPTTFPNKVLLYNYRNNTWAIFRDSITTFGTFQSSKNITWDSFSVFWDSQTTFWDDVDTQSLFPLIVCGNQQGYVSCYGYDSPSDLSTVDANDQETLYVQNVTTTQGVIVITSPDHNLQPEEIIYINGLEFINSSTFVPVSTSLNDKIYQVFQTLPDGTALSKDQFTISVWQFPGYANNFSYTPNLATSTYIGGGNITLFPKLNILSKDINIFQGKSLQTKLSRLDFLFQPVQNGQVSINLWLNASTNGTATGTVKGNKLVGNTKLSLNLTNTFYTPDSDYAWFRFYATLAAQYFSINITYDDDQMNTLATHSQDCTLYAINAWCRPGGKNTF